MIKLLALLAGIVCIVGAVVFIVTSYDAYADWTNLNCSQDTTCWPTDWEEVFFDGALGVGCLAGAMVLFSYGNKE